MGGEGEVVLDVGLEVEPPRRELGDLNPSEGHGGPLIFNYN